MLLIRQPIILALMLFVLAAAVLLPGTGQVTGITGKDEYLLSMRTPMHMIEGEQALPVPQPFAGEHRTECESSAASGPVLESDRVVLAFESDPVRPRLGSGTQADDLKHARRQRAVRVAVATGQNIGTQIEITPDQPEALPDGARIVMDGAAYLRDGDPINAFIEVEVKL